MAARILGLLALAMGVAAGFPVLAADLEPHRAIYTVSLDTVRGDAKVADARGVLTVSWALECDGWVVEQYYALRLAYHEYPDRDVRSVYRTWEARDGLSYRFEVETEHDGRSVERYHGVAELAPDGGGDARYSMPRGVSIALPSGTMFPVAHTRALLGAVERGEPVFHRVVFDGATMDQPMEINAIAAGRLEPDATARPLLAAGGDSAMEQAAGWRVRMAVFPLTDRLESPDYEIEMALLENGLVAEMLLDYDEFVLKATLAAVEPLPRPEC